MTARVGAASLFATVVFCSCRPAVSLDAELPADVSFVAVVSVDGVGNLVSTALIAVTPGEPLSLVRREEPRTHVYGWSSASLEAAGLLEGAELVGGTERLSLSTGCTTPLPEPSWKVEWEGDGLAVSTEAAQPLTAGWVQEICPEVTELLLDSTCDLGRCRAVETARTPCTRRIDGTFCNLGSMRVQISPTGRACVDSVELAACTRVEDEALAASLVCESLQCRVNFTRVPLPSPAPFTVSISSVADVQPWTPTSLDITRNFFGHHLRSGYLYDLAVLDDRVVVTGAVGKPRDQCPLGAHPTTVLYFLDPITFAPMESREAVGCLTRIVRDPMGPGFLGFFGAVPGRWSIGRFDPDGTLRDSVAIELVAENEADGLVEDLIITDGGQTLVAQVQRSLASGDWLITIDVASLAVRERFGIDGFVETEGIVEVTSTDFRQIAVLNRSNNPAFLLFDRPTHSLTRVGIPEDLALRSTLFALHYHAKTGYLLSGGRGHRELRASNLFADQWKASVFEHEDTLITRLDDWPESEDLVLASGIRMTTLEGWFGLADATRRRFLPSSITTGHGLVTRARPDRNGGVIALLPWAAQVAHVQPTR